MANKEKEEKEEQETTADKVLPTVEEAAAYAGVDVETVQKWVENGMVTLPDGSFVKNNLDLYKESNGNPPPRVKDQQIKSELELTKLAEEEKAKQKQEVKPEQEPKTAETEPSIPGKHIYTADELRGKGFPEELIPMCLQLLNSD
jgi:hypothetical protein